MKFLIDMPLSPALVGWLQQRGHSAIHASQVGLKRASDDTIMERAVEAGQTIVTADLDYPRLLAISHSSRPGVILFRSGDFSEREMIEGMDRALQAIPERDFSDALVIVERHRIRRIRLPLGSD